MNSSQKDAWKNRFFACCAVLLCAMPLAAEASQLSKLTLLDSDDGDVLYIEGDTALEYQVFDLDGPPRLILSFPSVSVGSDVHALKASGLGVLSVNPVTVNHGTRIEIALSQVLKYDIKEKNNELLVRFAETAKPQVIADHAAVLKDL